jgi:hypothetical protein
VLHIVEQHLQGLSLEMDSCTSIEEKVKIFTSEDYGTIIKEYGLDDSLYQPLLTLDENITRWRCLRCKMCLFKTEVEAERHVATEHYGKLLVPPQWFPEGCKTFGCSQLGCEKEYGSWRALLNHETLQHDAFKGYMGKVFKNDYLLKTNIPKKRLRD